MAISFDGATRLATLSSGTTSLDVVDLWSRWVDWFQTGDNSKWPLAMEQVGGNVIDAGAGTSIPAYIYLLNGWKVKPQEADHTLNVGGGGILLVNGGGDPFVDTSGAYVVRINYQQPVQAVTVATGGGSAPTASQVADAVWAHADASTLQARILLATKLLRNKTITDPATGVMTVYDDDGSSVLLTAQMYEDAGAGQTYRGQGAERRERLA